jgi:hypothetical protein
MRYLLLVAVALTTLACTQSDSSTKPNCVITSLEASDSPLMAEVEYWRLEFSVKLIGCKEDLETLSPEELEQIRDALLRPERWSNLFVIKRAHQEEFRQLVVHEINSIVGRDVATDVEYHDMTLFDHNKI